jgi:glycosyltransferase involved in cell wall biosynthesis
MNMGRPNLVVLTPVRNEAWILPRFLEVTGRLADKIIILDQNSTDGSAELCQAHPKVHLLKNPSREYNEAERQRILIDAARKLVPMPRVLLALDADEIIAANAPSTKDWSRGLSAKPGTVLYIEKPTFFGGMEQVIRYPDGFPLGFVDDNSRHDAKLIHSVRIPTPAGVPILKLDEVKVLHYALIRPKAQAAKNRMYSVIENISHKSHVLARRAMYRADKDYSLEGPLEPTDPRWLEGWEDQGINMRFVPDQDPHWHDFEVLHHMAEHGPRRFWLDDIWQVDWELYRRQARQLGIAPVPQKPIRPPPAVLSSLMRLADAGYCALRSLRFGKPARQLRTKSPAQSRLHVHAGTT